MEMGLSPIYLNKGTDSRLGLTKKDSDLLEIVHLSFDFISFSLCIHTRGVARGGSGVPVTPPLGRPSFEQTTYNIQVAKTP